MVLDLRATSRILALLLASSSACSLGRLAPGDAGADAGGGGDAVVDAASDVGGGADAPASDGAPAAALDGGAQVGDGDAGPVASAAPPIYRLVAGRQFNPPNAASTGIAEDSTGLWILSGGQNAAQNKLVHLSPDTLAIDKTFTYKNLEQTLGSGAYGITWDGASVWISISGNTDELVTVDPTTGAIARTLVSPTYLGPSDLEWDGVNMWLSSGTGTVYKLNPSNSMALAKFPIAPDSYGRDYGIAVRGSEVWVCNLFGGLEVYDATTGTVTGSVMHADGTPFGTEQKRESGAMFFSASGQLVVLNDFGVTYYDVVPW